MKHLNSSSRQRGFALTTLFMVLALFAIIAALFATAGRSQPTSTDPEKARANATGIIASADGLRQAIQRYSQDRDIATMTLATTASVGLYDPALSLATQNDAPADSGTTGSPLVYSLNTADIVVTGLATAAAERSIVLTPLNTLVCQQINRQLHADSIDTAVPTTVGTRQEGCASIAIGAASAANTYFKVVQPR